MKAHSQNVDNNEKEFAFDRKFVENCARLNQAKQQRGLGRAITGAFTIKWHRCGWAKFVKGKGASLSPQSGIIQPRRRNVEPKKRRIIGLSNENNSNRFFSGVPSVSKKGHKCTLVRTRR